MKMNIIQAVKKVRRNPNKFRLRYGPYLFSVKKGRIYDSKDRLVNLTASEITAKFWQVEEA